MNLIEILLTFFLIKNEPKIVSPIPADGQVILVSPKPKYYGKVSWYKAVFDGKNCDDKDCITAFGEIFTGNELTTACPARYPLGTKFRVTHKRNSVEVVCDDRGIFEKKFGRLLDLSEKAFSQLAATSAGIIWAEIEVIK